MSLLSYISIVYAVVADVAIFDQTFLPKEIVGAAIITLFNLLTIWYKVKYCSEAESQNTT